MTRFLYTWVVVIYRSLVSLIGIPGNILILAVYWDKQALGSAQVFIQTLALSDLYVCLLLPLEIHFWLHEFDHNDLFLCKLFFTVGTIGLYVSTFVTVAIALDRYLAVAKPVNGRWSRKKAQKISLLCLFLAVFINLAVPFSSHLDPKQIEGIINGTSCYSTGLENPTVLDLLVLIPQYISTIGAFVFIGILYVKLWIVVTRQRKKIGIKEVKYDNDTSVVGENMSQTGFTKTSAVEYNTSAGQCTATNVAEKANNNETDRRLETRGKGKGNVLTKESSGTSMVSFDAKGTTIAVKASRGRKEEHCSEAKFNGQLDDPTDSMRGHVPSVTNKGGPVVTSKVKGRRGQHQVVSRLTLMLLLSTVIFFITWFTTLLTFGLSSLTRKFFGNNIAYVIVALLRLSGFINNAINPLVYSFMNPRFRADCRALYKRLKSRLCTSHRV
ncbi:uncharacterized protein [Apostichopus japonicus]|uniref:uncharacterized protein n=1 Tax=Stichopus japonicus TaxID=307972 RepID=UPI003AB7BA02